MITRISALIAVVGLAGICRSQAQSPSPPEPRSPSQTPAKQRAMKKAKATPAPATHPTPSSSPGKFNLGDLFKPRTSAAAILRQQVRQPSMEQRQSRQIRRNRAEDTATYGLTLKITC